MRDNEGQAVIAHILSLTPFRRIVKDYFMICDSYYAAIKTATPSQIETIDMARRGLHNEGSQILRDRLTEKIEVDFDNGTSAVHAHLRAALERLSRDAGAPERGAFRMRPQCGPLPPWPKRSPSILFPRQIYVQSAGVRKDSSIRSRSQPSKRSASSLASIKPKTIDELEDTNFDLIITLAPEAHHKALISHASMNLDVEYWPTPDPQLATGSRDQINGRLPADPRHADPQDQGAAALEARWRIVMPPATIRRGTPPA